jgi:hypothetical protein
MADILKQLDPAIKASVQNYLQRLIGLGFNISFGVVYGSQVNGSAGPLSDIDLVVVSDRFDGKIVRSDIDTLWEVAAETDCRIEPIPCGRMQWQSDTGIPIFEIARQEGQTVYAAYFLWINSKKVGESSRFAAGIYRIEASGINMRRGPKSAPAPCRMAPPRRSGRFPAEPCLPGRQPHYTQNMPLA